MSVIRRPWAVRDAGRRRLWVPTRPAGRSHTLCAVVSRLWFDGATELAEAGWLTNGVMMAEDVRAEIVASVLEVVVNEGDQIGEGDTLVLLESMKMEIPVLAEVAGTVSKVSVSVGDVIQAGDLIAVIS